MEWLVGVLARCGKVKVDVWLSSTGSVGPARCVNEMPGRVVHRAVDLAHTRRHVECACAVHRCHAPFVCRLETGHGTRCWFHDQQRREGVGRMKRPKAQVWARTLGVPARHGPAQRRPWLQMPMCQKRQAGRHRASKNRSPRRSSVLNAKTSRFQPRPANISQEPFNGSAGTPEMHNSQLGLSPRTVNRAPPGS